MGLEIQVIICGVDRSLFMCAQPLFCGPGPPMRYICLSCGDSEVSLFSTEKVVAVYITAAGSSNSSTFD